MSAAGRVYGAYEGLREKGRAVTGSLVRNVDEIVLSWPDVKAKQVFGHRGYVRARKMFGFLMDDAVAVKVTSDADSAELFGRDEVVPFTYSGMEMRGWAILPVRSQADVDDVLSWLQRGYEAV